MAWSNKLCNPTPFHVSFPYSSGLSLEIPPFGEIQLRDQAQVTDFLPNVPGAETIQNLCDVYGIFLRDNDRPYQAQAIEAIRRTIRVKEERYSSAYNRQREAMAAAGHKDDAVIEEQMKRIGLVTLREKTEVLKKQLSQYEAKFTEEVRAAETYDPARTIFAGVDQPKEFPTKEAMEFYLSLPENKAVKKAHEEFTKETAKASKNVSE
jgi:hypothetical protein